MLITLLAAMNCVICVYYAGDLLMLLNVSSEGVLLTTYGKLQPPLGKHRLKVVHICMICF